MNHLYLYLDVAVNGYYRRVEDFINSDLSLCFRFIIGRVKMFNCRGSTIWSSSQKSPMIRLWKILRKDIWTGIFMYVFYICIISKDYMYEYFPELFLF